MTNEEIVLALRQAKEHLFTTGWIQEDYGTADGPNCIMGAFYRAIGEDWEQPVRIDHFPINRAFSVAVGHIPVIFNDMPGRTFDEVIDAIDLVIKGLEGQLEDVLKVIDRTMAHLQGRNEKMNTEEVVDLLNEMKTQLFEYGWCQGTIQDRETGNVCLMGALTLALRKNKNWETDKFSKIRDLLAVSAGTADENGRGAISKWNDEKERTFGDVVSLIDDTIITVKGRSQ